MYVYEFKDVCIRCDPQSKQKKHLCQKCYGYLKENLNEPIVYESYVRDIYVEGRREREKQSKGDKEHLEE